MQRAWRGCRRVKLYCGLCWQCRRRSSFIATRPSPASGPAIYCTPGEWSARLIIVALMLTPLGQLFPQSGPVKWLIRHRRAFGVAAFGYALLHLIFYVLDMETVAAMLAELGAPGIWTGWLALLCLALPALTSTTRRCACFGAMKRLQRFAYPRRVTLPIGCWSTTDDLSFGSLRAAYFASVAAVSRTIKPNERKIA